MKPVLLLIPGMFNTAQVWQALLPGLQAHVQLRIANVLTQDSITAMADDAWRLVADLPAGTPLLVCGFSMGGYVAIEMLATRRAQVHALALVDTSARPETAESLLLREKTISALERNFERTVEGIIAFSLHPQSLQNTALVDGMRAMMHTVGAQNALRQTRALMVRRDHRAMLSQWAMPTLITCGREDKVTPPALSEELKALVPHAQLEWIDDAGHQTVLEQAPFVARHLMTLVRQVVATD